MQRPENKSSRDGAMGFGSASRNPQGWLPDKSRCFVDRCLLRPCPESTLYHRRLKPGIPVWSVSVDIGCLTVGHPAEAVDIKAVQPELITAAAYWRSTLDRQRLWKTVGHIGTNSITMWTPRPSLHSNVSPTKHETASSSPSNAAFLPDVVGLVAAFRPPPQLMALRALTVQIAIVLTAPEVRRLVPCMTQ
jgi:hypothetical protein